jgi:membrane protein involved in colicin uptake
MPVKKLERPSPLRAGPKTAKARVETAARQARKEKAARAPAKTATSSAAKPRTLASASSKPAAAKPAAAKPASAKPASAKPASAKPTERRTDDFVKFTFRSKSTFPCDGGRNVNTLEETSTRKVTDWDDFAGYQVKFLTHVFKSMGARDANVEQVADAVRAAVASSHGQ